MFTWIIWDIQLFSSGVVNSFIFSFCTDKKVRIMQCQYGSFGILFGLPDSIWNCYYWINLKLNEIGFFFNNFQILKTNGNKYRWFQTLFPLHKIILIKAVFICNVTNFINLPLIFQGDNKIYKIYILGSLHVYYLLSNECKPLLVFI